MDTITGSDGTVTQRLSYDAFGQRRQALDWTPGIPGVSELDSIRAITNRGYTDHAMVDDLNLIHMNGRVYDPEVGRFISADPFVSRPFDTQGFNRYSYVQNNPLAFVDPSGFVDEDGGQDLAPFTVESPCWGCMPDGFEQFLRGAGDRGENIARVVGDRVGTFPVTFSDGSVHQITIKDIDPDNSALGSILETLQEVNNQLMANVDWSQNSPEPYMTFMSIMSPVLLTLNAANTLLTPAYHASTRAGDSASMYYASQIVSGNGNWMDHVGLGLASLWTPDTAPITAGVLSLGSGGALHAARPFWRYVGPNSLPGSPWLTRGIGWAAPYGDDMVRARNALQLPYMPTSVTRVNVPWWHPVIGRQRRLWQFSLGSWWRHRIRERVVVTMKRLFAASPTDYFDQQTWANLTRIPQALALKVSIYARNAGIKVAADSRWPMIRLKKRRYLRVTVVTFGLQSSYLQDRQVFWEVRFQTVWNVWIFTSHISGGLLSKFTSQQITDDEANVLQEIKEIVDATLLQR